MLPASQTLLESVALRVPALTPLDLVALARLMLVVYAMEATTLLIYKENVVR